MHLKELRRQLVHISGLAIAFLVLMFGADTPLLLCILATIFFFTLSLYSRRRKGLRKRLFFRVLFLEQLEDAFFREIDKFDRKTEYNYLGAFTFFLGASVVLYFFPLDVAVLAIVVLSVADGLSTLVGANFGRHKLSWNKKKSWEGFSAGLLGTFLVCLLLTTPTIALIAAISGSLVESSPDNLNDNLTIPIIVALVLSVI